MRLGLTIAYDGARFCGWQSQPQRGSVQDVLELVMTRLAGGEPVSVCASGRTDAGVHALGQVAHADVPEGRGDADFWRRIMNLMLPPSVRVVGCRQVADDFHARFMATGKIYEYRLSFADALPPHEVGRAWHVYQEVDRGMFSMTAEILKGRHDFKAFAANRRTPVRETVRNLRKIEVVDRGEEMTLRFEGDGFLYKMVRMLVAAMVLVARGRATLDDLRARLEGRETNMARDVAPPDGLYLMKVYYDQMA